MKEPQITVEIRKPGKPGSIRAFADVSLSFPDGKLDLIGFAVVGQPGKSPWVAFPANHGQNKYFQVVDAKGRLRDQIIKNVLGAYEKWKERQ